MPVRVRAKPPGEFIRDHLVDVGGMDYTQATHKAYKDYLRVQGLKTIPCKEAMTHYFWLARKLGLIEFDHAETSDWADGFEVPPGYEPTCPPICKSPRHYYRIINPADPRWIRLEASYRQSIGIEVPPPFPRVPVLPPPVAAPPVPKPKKVKKPPKEKKPPVPKPPKPPTAEELAAPFEARIQTVRDSLDQIARNPTMELANAIEAELESISLEAKEASRPLKGKPRERLVAINLSTSNALYDVPALKASIRTIRRETLPSRQASARQGLNALLGLIRESLERPPE